MGLLILYIVIGTIVGGFVAVVDDDDYEMILTMAAFWPLVVALGLIILLLELWEWTIKMLGKVFKWIGETICKVIGGLKNVRRKAEKTI